MANLKQEEKAIKAIYDYYESKNRNGYLGKAYLNRVVGEENVDSVLSILRADGYVKVEGIEPSIRIGENNPAVVRLTDKGKTYFVDQQRKQRISRRQFFQSAAIAVISAVVSTLLTLLVTQRSEESETSSSQV